MKILGKCPYCEDGKIETRPIEVNGKKVKLYACSNAHWELDQDIFALTEDSTCDFRIFSNQYLRYHKRSIGEGEIRELLKEGECEIRLYNNHKKEEYFKTMILDQEYGSSILW